jgi:phage gpG-like protein
MPKLKVEVTGIKQISGMLKDLSPDESQEIVVKSLQDCAKLVQINAVNKQIMGGGAKAVSRGRGVQIKPHPTRLTSRTGTLRRSISINQQRVPAWIDIGTDLKYGAVHELGFKGNVFISGHYREITQAFGRRIKPTEVAVRSHVRSVNIPKRPFLKPALEEVEDRFPAIFMKHWRRVANV